LQDLVDTLAGNGGPTAGTMRLTDGREQQSEVIVDFGYRSDRGAWTASDGFLFNRDRGGKTFDRIDVRLLELIQKLTCVRRKRFHIAPLTLSIDRVKCQGRFA